MKKIFIVLLILLFLTSCGQETAFSPIREEVKSTVTNLGVKKSDSKPVILINDGEDTLYIGETDFEFDVEAYSDNGEVTISFDDSAVDYQKEGSYEVKVLVKDPFEQGEDNTDLTLKKKPVVRTNPGTGNSDGTASSGTGDNSNNTNCRLTCLGTFCSYADFLAYAESRYAVGMLSDRSIDEVRSHSDWY